ncbi:nuclease-related domain-containing protein [Nocardioides marmoraquaticus]
MSELAVPSGGTTVVRWRRFGHDRLYVKDAAGADLGYWDLASETAHPSEERWRVKVVTAAAAWAGRPAPAAAAPPRVEEAVERPWVDLAGNRPGESVRKVADSFQAAAPVRTALGRMLGVRTEATTWRQGAVGEEKVGGQLAKLCRKDRRWRVLHAIDVGSQGSDIDHLVIGPGGVFTLNAKHHRGAEIWVGGNTVMVNGQRQPYVRNARFEADRAARLLGAVCAHAVPVKGVVVPVNARDVVVKAQPVDVQVVPRLQLVAWLLRHGEILDDERIDSIYGAARRSTTWRP